MTLMDDFYFYQSCKQFFILYFLCQENLPSILNFLFTKGRRDMVPKDSQCPQIFINCILRYILSLLCEAADYLEIHKDAVKNFHINRKEKEDLEQIFQVKITIQVSFINFKDLYDMSACALCSPGGDIFAI